VTRQTLITIAVLGALAGCGGAAACPVASPTAPTGPPLLWKVQGKAGPVWLFGTIHDGGAELVPAAAWAALDGAPRFASELGDVEPDPDAIRALMRLPRGKGLDQLLPTDHWWELRDALRGEIDEADLARARPWYAMSLLSRAVSPRDGAGMDVLLAERAADRGVPVDALESWEEQLGVLADAVTIDDLVEAIDARETMRCDLAANRAAYASGDLAEMERIFGAERSGKLLGPRHRTWLPRIEGYLAEGGAFVAVGIGHLVGPEGLPALLAAAGYAVTRE
jgi:uncharacterized protein YbaP (TraB family)